MVSGSTDVDDAIRAFRAGAVPFVSKPFHRQALIGTPRKAEAVGLVREAEARRHADASRINLTSASVRCWTR